MKNLQGNDVIFELTSLIIMLIFFDRKVSDDSPLRDITNENRPAGNVTLQSTLDDSGIVSDLGLNSTHSVNEVSNESLDQSSLLLQAMENQQSQIQQEENIQMALENQPANDTAEDIEDRHAEYVPEEMLEMPGNRGNEI